MYAREPDVLEQDLKRDSGFRIELQLAGIGSNLPRRKNGILKPFSKKERQSILRMYKGQLRNMEEHHRQKVLEI